MRADVNRILEVNIYEESAVHRTVTLGLCLMVAFSRNDSLEDLNHIIKKVLHLKVFNDNESEKPWSMNIVQKGYGIMVLMQPTLFSHFDGYEPQFEDAMELRFAMKYFKMFIRMLKKVHKPDLVTASHFRILKRPMKAQVIHNGPILFTLHSPKVLVRSPVEKFIKAYGLDWYVLDSEADRHLRSSSDVSSEPMSDSSESESSGEESSENGSSANNSTS